MKNVFAEWSAATKDSLPDSSFAYISPGGKKDSGGKTVPRSLRHLPYKDASGKIDAPHLRNALARLAGTNIPANAKANIRKTLEAALEKQKASERHIGVFPLEFDDAPIPTEIHLIPIGQWKHDAYGEIVITPADIQQFADNFNAGLRKGVPITAGHEGAIEQPAVGWVTKVEARESGLWGTVDWNEQGKALLSDKAFKFFSPEFFRSYEDPQTHDLSENVLVGGALTKAPYFKELEAVVFSEPKIKNQFNDTMNIADILAKQPADLTDEEKAFVREHQDELSDEQKTVFEPVLKDEEASPVPETTPEVTPEAAPEVAPEAPIEASEKGMKKISAAEYALLQDKANKGAQAFAELEKLQIGQRVERLTFSQSNTDGRFLPKQKDAVVTFMLALSEKQRDQFSNIVSHMPKIDKQLFSEMGDGGQDVETSAAAEVDTKVKAEMKSNEKLSYSDALRKVFRENAGLEQRYNDAQFGEDN